MKEKKDKKILIIFFFIALMLDQISKIIAYTNGWNISNEASNNGYNIAITLIIVLMIIRYISTDNTFIKLDTKIILTLAMAGAIGNLIDRVWNKNVIIFINLGRSIYLNLSYIYILIAWIGFAAILTKNTMIIIKNRKKVKENGYKKNSSK